MTTLLLGLVTGLAFGFALHRAGFKRPNLVQRGLWIRDFTMVKLMLTAILVSLVGMYVLAEINPGLVHFKIKPLYVLGVAVGGLIFGTGMALSGYCPGTSLVGLASRHGEAAMAFVGALAGAVVFIFSYPALKPILIEPANLGRITIPSVLGTPPLLTALVFAVLIGGAIWGLDRLSVGPEGAIRVRRERREEPHAAERPAA